jgi:hypothetical protein
MSKVFSAKTAQVEFEYELGGKKALFAYRGPTTSEVNEELEREGKITGSEIVKLTREKALNRLTAKGAISVEELIKDQEKSGNLYDLINELDALVVDEKNAKRRS